jgi:PAS domain S-box-containing protein
MAISRDITTRITGLLKNHPGGLSITDIVKTVRVNRNTASRYLDTLLVSGQVEMRHFGMAKIYSLTRRMPVSSVLSLSPAFVLQLDHNFRITFLSAPFLDLLGISEQDIIGKKIEHTQIPSLFGTEYTRFLQWISEGLSGLERSGELNLDARDRIFSCRVTPAVFTEGQKGVSVLLEDITARKRDEERLRNSEARLRSIIRTAPVGIGHMVHQVIREVNDRLCEMTGYPSDELIGKPARILSFLEDESGRIETGKNSTIGWNGTESQEVRWIRKDGVVIDVLLSSTPLEPGRMSAGVIFTALDITGHKRAEAALRESEERYRKLVEILPDAVIVHHNEKIIYANPAARKLTGASHQEEIVGRPVLDFINPRFHEVVISNIRKDLGGEVSPLTELQMIRLDGTSVTVEGRGVRTLIDGKPAVLVAMRDISERKKSEEDLFNSRQMLQLVIDTIPVRVFWKDRNSVYLGANHALALDAGYSDPAELIGKTDYETTYAETADLYRADDRGVMETGIPKLNYEEPQTKPDGSRAWLRTSKVPLRNRAGEVIGVLGTYEDITERRVKEDALRASEERYRRLLEQSFDAVIIHKEGKITCANSVALALAGARSPGELVGQPILRFVHPDFQAIVRDRAEKMIAVPGTTMPLVHEMFHRLDGETLKVEVMATSFIDNGTPAVQVVFRKAPGQ